MEQLQARLILSIYLADKLWRNPLRLQVRSLSLKTGNGRVGYDENTGAQLWAVNRTTPTGATTFGLMGPLVERGSTLNFIKTRCNGTATALIRDNNYGVRTTAYTNPWGSEVFTSTSAYGNYYAESIRWNSRI